MSLICSSLNRPPSKYNSFKRIPFTDWIAADTAIFKDYADLALSQGFIGGQNISDRYAVYYRLNRSEQKFWHRQVKHYQTYLFRASCMLVKILTWYKRRKLIKATRLITKNTSRVVASIIAQYL